MNNLQCYWVDSSDKRCPNKSTDELECWCSPEHKKEWQEKNYSSRKTTIADIQKRIKERSEKR